MTVNTPCVLSMSQNQLDWISTDGGPSKGSARVDVMGKNGPTSEFWKRLTNARDEARLSRDQEAIAKELGVWQSAVTKWKTGKGLPTLSKAIEIANRADVCVEWLLTGRGPRRPGAVDDPKLARLIGLWDKLLPETADEVLSFAIFKRASQNQSAANRIREIQPTDLPVSDIRARRAANHKGPRSE